MTLTLVSPPVASRPLVVLTRPQVEKFMKEEAGSSMYPKLMRKVKQPALPRFLSSHALV